MSAYTRRRLTKPDQDKLRAIQGISDRMTKRGSYHYVHGVFWHHLPRALCWARMEGYANRPQPLRAPSWSWASMNGRIDLMLGYDPKVSTQLNPLPQALLAAIVAVTPADYNELSQQHWARLVCVGKLLSMASTHGHDLEFDLEMCTFKIGNALIKIELDSPAENGPDLGHDIYFLPIFERGSPAEPVGLALASNGDGSFSRVGVTKRYKPSAEPEILMQAYRAAKSRLLLLV